MERQYKGFEFEEYIIQHYQLDTTNLNYTSAWDAFYKGTPVSIKHIQSGGAICLGDVRRQATINQDFILIVGLYNQKSEALYDELYFLYIPATDWNNLFPNMTIINNLYDTLKEISNEIADDAKWCSLRQSQICIWKKECGTIITLNGKRDHKSQKRWQCSINQTNWKTYILPKFKINWGELQQCLNLQKVKE